MYIDSEEEEMEQFMKKGDKSSKKKKVKTEQLSPMEEERKSEHFYPVDSTDLEKVIHYSVISSGRQYDEGSLDNTQKYVPLRTKVHKKDVSSTSTSAPRTAIKAEGPVMT